MNKMKMLLIGALACAGAASIQVAAAAGINPARKEVYSRFTVWLAAADEASVFRLFGGGRQQPSEQWQKRLALLKKAPALALNLTVVTVSQKDIKGVLGAFCRDKAKGGTSVLYLNREWLNGPATAAELQLVFAEGLGHAIDEYLNADGETPGDEGKLFAHTLLGLPMGTADGTPAVKLDDRAVVCINNQAKLVEAAGCCFVPTTAGQVAGLLPF